MVKKKHFIPITEAAKLDGCCQKTMRRIIKREKIRTAPIRDKTFLLVKDFEEYQARKIKRK